MTTINSGGPAFPWCGDLNECPTINLGMSLHDYFMAHSGVTWQDALIVVNRSGEKATIRLVADTLVVMRHAVADAMLRPRGTA